MNESSPQSDRRSFLLAAATAAAGGVLIGGCAKTEDPFRLEKPPVPGGNGFRKGEEHFVSTACGQCAAGCSVQGRVVEGHLVKLEGNAACPINRGGIGPRGLSGTQVLYDPDRIHEPLMRTGPRGSGNFKPITWEEAIAQVASRLTGLREKNEPHRAAVVCGRERGMMLEGWRRFTQIYGTPNFFDSFSHANGAVAQAFELLTGNREIPAYDWQSTQYILSLDSGILESSCQTIYFARAQAHLRRGNAHLRAKIVHAGQGMTRTAINADETIALPPATAGAFALGICHILVRDGLYDKPYVEQHCSGFEAWKDEAGVAHAGFRDVLQAYTPAAVQKLCGVSEKTLLRIAGEMASSRPAFAITDLNATLASNGLQTAWAAQALNALLGMINRPGGVLVQLAPPTFAWDALKPDDVSVDGLKKPRLDGVGAGDFPLASSVYEALPEAILSGQPYALDTLLLYYSNPLHSKIDPDRWRKALAQVPFIVTFSPFMDETATEMADLILPDHTYLERWEDSASAPATGYPIFGIRQPVVDPLHQTMATGDAMIAIAKKIGGSVAGAFPWKDFKDALMRRVFGLFKAQKGTIVEDSGAKFLNKLYQQGYWSDETYPFDAGDKLLKTASGKIELFSRLMQDRLQAVSTAKNRPIEQVLADLHLPADLDHACLPHYSENRWQGDPAQYPLLLIPYRPNTYAEGSGANLPLLQEVPLYKGRPLWTTEAQLHPDTARANGIAAGDFIRIESALSSIKVPVFITAGIQPGLIRVPMGGGHTAFGRWAANRGANVMGLLSRAGIDPLTGLSPLLGTRVHIRKATDQ